MITREVTDDKVVVTTTTVTEHDRIVEFADILESVSVENDDWMSKAPWDHCDGWDHEAVSYGHYTHHKGIRDSRGYARTGHADGPNVIIIIDEDDIVKKWGCDGYPGASKQVRAELIAQIKRNALDQLVKWYEDGWSWYCVRGEYNGYSNSVHGIDCPVYAETMCKEIADEIADQMESDGYIIVGRSEPCNHAEINRENHAILLANYVIHARYSNLGTDIKG